MPPLCTLNCVFTRSWQVPAGLRGSGERNEAAACGHSAVAYQKPERMASPINLTVALDIYAWNATVKLPGTRWAGRLPGRQAPGGWPGWSPRHALPCLPCRLPACRHLPTDSTGCARWLSGPVPGGCGDTVGVCGGVLLSSPARAGLQRRWRGCGGGCRGSGGGGALPTMAQGQQSIPDGWTVGCPSLPALSP